MMFQSFVLHLQDLLVRAQNRVRKSVLKFPKMVDVGKIYLCYLSAAFHRIQIIETREKCCECFYIDTGKCDTIEYGSIYMCTPEFTKLPPLAVRFQLNGLEDLQNCPNIGHLFNAWLCGKYFQGCISITEADYRMQLRNHGFAKIPILLYHMHPRCMMLLKPMLMQQIGESLPKPKLPFDYTKTKVSHISCDGTIYLQADWRSIHYIETQIDRTIKQHKHSTNRMANALNASSSIALVYDTKQNTYFRARITAEDNGSAHTYRCYFMDLGSTKSIANFDIIRIDKDSILRYYPDQAMATKLESVSVFDDTVLQRLNSILAPGTIVEAKMVKYGDKLPMVVIKKRKMNINKLIYMEVELREYVTIFISRIYIYFELTRSFNFSYDMPLPCVSTDDEL